MDVTTNGRFGPTHGNNKRRQQRQEDDGRRRHEEIAAETTAGVLPTLPGPPAQRVSATGSRGVMKTLLSLVGRLFYWATNWQFEPRPAYFRSRHVIIGFPHTSNMDTVRAFFGFKIIKQTGHIMIKQEWFVFPLSLFLRALGGIPVERNAPRGVVGQMARAFRERDDFLLAIVPEGTRKKVSTIRTGFWHIAQEADVSIICWYLDNERQRTCWLGEVKPGGDKIDDLKTIQRLYARAGYEVPIDIDAVR